MRTEEEIRELIKEAVIEALTIDPNLLLRKIPQTATEAMASIKTLNEQKEGE